MRFVRYVGHFICGLICAAVLASCGTEPPEVGKQDAPQPESRAVDTDPDMIARRVVAENLGLPVEDIVVISAEAREFSDSSLGCPAPDTAYLQVLTPGHQVIVEGDGRRFDVRVSGTSGKICHRRKSAPPTPDRSRDAATSELINRTIEHLASVLNLDSENIRVTGIQPYLPSTLLTGCSPECGPESKACGNVVRLSAEGRDYTYFVGDDRTMPCPPILTS